VLAQRLAQILQMPDIQEKFAASFLDPMPQGPDAFTRFLEADVRQWQEVVAQTGVIVDKI